jgi:hypothetical protein
MPQEHEPLKQKLTGIAQTDYGQASSKLASPTFQHIKEPTVWTGRDDSQLFLKLIPILNTYLTQEYNGGKFFVVKNDLKITL